MDDSTQGPRRLLILAAGTAALSLLLLAIDMTIKRQVLEEAAQLRKEIKDEQERRATLKPRPRGNRAAGGSRVPGNGRADAGEASDRDSPPDPG